MHLASSKPRSRSDRQPPRAAIQESHADGHQSRTIQASVLVETATVSHGKERRSLIFGGAG